MLRTDPAVPIERPPTVEEVLDARLTLVALRAQEDDEVAGVRGPSATGLGLPALSSRRSHRTNPDSGTTTIVYERPLSRRARRDSFASARETSAGRVDHPLGGNGASSSGWSSGAMISLSACSPDQDLLAELSDPDGRSVVRLARIWEHKITKDHPQVRAHLEHVLATVTSPTMPSPTRAQGGAATTAAEWARAGGFSWS
jgi:hypothetical protein